MKQLLRVVAFIIFSSAIVHAQTIADLARRERARRQSTPNPVVITNERLKTAPKSEQQPGAPAPSPLVIPQPPAPDLPGGHDEKWWREQFDKTRQTIQRLETQIPLLESNFNTANLEFLTRSYDPDGRGKRAIDESKTAVERTKADLAKAQERLAQLEEDLRRAGGPAGWSR